MKKGIIFIGPARSRKSLKAMKIATNYSEESVRVFYSGQESLFKSKFGFSECNSNTELIIIDNLMNLSDIEGFFNTITGDGLIIHKRGSKPFCIKPRILIICDSKFSTTDLTIGSSFTERFDVYQFPEAYDQEIEFTEIKR